MNLRTVTIHASRLGIQPSPSFRAVSRASLSVRTAPLLQFATDEAIDSRAREKAINSEKPAILGCSKSNEERISRPRACRKTLLNRVLADRKLPRTVKLLPVFEDRAPGFGPPAYRPNVFTLPWPVGATVPNDSIVGNAGLTKMAQSYAFDHTVTAITVPVPGATLYKKIRLDGPPTGPLSNAPSTVFNHAKGAEHSLLAAAQDCNIDSVFFAAPFSIPHYASGKIHLTDAFVAKTARITRPTFRISAEHSDCVGNNRSAEAGFARQRDANHEGKALTLGIGAAKLNAHISVSPPSTRRIDGRAAKHEGAAL